MSNTASALPDEDDVEFHWLDEKASGSAKIDGKYFYVTHLGDGGRVWDSAKYNGDRHLIYGGDGDGNDVIYGGTGRDWLYGEASDDVIHGGKDADVIYGGAGNDVIYGGNGADELYGGAGDDIIHGGKGDDVIHGGSGNDWLFTGTIDGGANDRLFGGSGSDTFVIGEVEAASTELIGVNWLMHGINLGGGAAYIALRSVIGGSMGHVGKEIVPVVVDIVKGITKVEKDPPPKASFVTVEDFNPACVLPDDDTTTTIPPIDPVRVRRYHPVCRCCPRTTGRPSRIGLEPALASDRSGWPRRT